MTSFQKIYMAVWVFFSICALAAFIGSRRRFVIADAAYWWFLLTPWKLVTFGVAASGLTIMAPYTGDPTWDYIDAIFMAVFAYLLAPWVVGEAYLMLRGKRTAYNAPVIAAAWLFSASWSYDLYNLIKFGVYPSTWLANLFASSVLFFSAGLFWNLDWREGRGTIFAFMEEDWPKQQAGNVFHKLLWMVVPFMALVGLLLIQFIW
ncbi:MAG: hypothetical protein OEZ04_02740 [Nitrospinota bacterium]|nr:hypothetical protein [Nitrospinota bacterium]